MTPTIVLDKDVEGKMAEEKVKKVTKIEKLIAPHSYQKEFKECLAGIEREFGFDLFQLSGVGKQLDMNWFAKQFFGKKTNTADVSVDSNSNVGLKNVVIWSNESVKPMKLLNSYYRMWKGMKKRYGLEYANEAVKKQLTGEIYVNDFHSFSDSLYYCYNYSTLDTANKGIPKGIDAEVSRPTKYLNTFFEHLQLFMVHAGASSLGACGVADLLLTVSAYVKRILTVKGDQHVNFVSEEDCWTYVKEKLTNFIYFLNQPNRIVQSLFSNVSIYDDYFLDTMLEFYFIEADDTYYFAEKDIVKRVQKIFVETMNEIMHQRIITFPVVTACFSLDDERNIQDEEFLKWVIDVDKEFRFINLYAGATSTLSSCCFGGTQTIRVRINGEEITVPFETLAHTYGMSTGSALEVWDKGTYRPATFVRIKNEENMYFISLADGSSIICTGNHIFPTADGDKTTEELLNIEAPKLLKADSTEIEITDIGNMPEHDNEVVYCVNMDDKTDPYFTLPNGIRVGNCRLRSDKTNKWMSSIGSSGSRIGSLGVTSQNLPRLAYKAHGSIEEFKKALEYNIILSQRINNVKRGIIKKAIDEKMFPLYNLGYVDLKTQYSTTGVVGIYEALQTLGYDIKTPEGEAVAEDLLSFISDVTDRCSEEHKAPCNVEQIRAENVAVKLAKKDKLLGYNDKYEIYSNQYVPLKDNDCDLFTRIRLVAHLDKYMSGGSILHININEENVPTETLVEMAKTMYKQGVVYFAFNKLLACCNEEGCGKVFTTDKETFDKNEVVCPVCGSHNTECALRIVGFIRKFSSWSSERQAEGKQRKFYSNFVKGV